MTAMFNTVDPEEVHKCQKVHHVGLCFNYGVPFVPKHHVSKTASLMYNMKSIHCIGLSVKTP